MQPKISIELIINRGTQGKSGLNLMPRQCFIMDIPIEKEGRYETFYGIMAAAQLEIRSHYFIRGEYQWALKSDYDGIDERRTNMFSVSLGYRF